VCIPQWEFPVAAKPVFPQGRVPLSFKVRVFKALEFPQIPPRIKPVISNLIGVGVNPFKGATSPRNIPGFIKDGQSPRARSPIYTIYRPYGISKTPGFMPRRAFLS